MRVDQDISFLHNCTGCHACQNICSCHAIVMTDSEDGFLYPKINNALCVDCGACYRVCPLTKEMTVTPILGTYSGYATDASIVTSSSSGGVFYHLAQKILREGGVVFGAAFDPVNKEVRHMSTDEIALEKIMRSKYVQSRIGNVYADVACALNENRSVLFVGTPCQVRGLKSFLGKKSLSDKLETADFMCHGVPSVGFFKLFLNSLEQKYQSPVIDVTFREKDNGWRKQIIKAYFANGHIWKETSLQYYYYYYFLHNYSLRDCCYDCQEYRSHTSDLTLADDWTSKTAKNEMGTSLIFVNTDNGQKMLDEIREMMTLTQTQIQNLSVYAHEGKSYENSKKEAWVQAWKTNGFEYMCEEYYRKVAKKEKVLKYWQRILHYAKRGVKLIRQHL